MLAQWISWAHRDGFTKVRTGAIDRPGIPMWSGPARRTKTCGSGPPSRPAPVYLLTRALAEQLKAPIAPDTETPADGEEVSDDRRRLIAAEAAPGWSGGPARTRPAAQQNAYPVGVRRRVALPELHEPGQIGGLESEQAQQVGRLDLP